MTHLRRGFRGSGPRLVEDGDAAGRQAQAEAAERVAAVTRTQAGAHVHAHLAAEVAAAVGAAVGLLPG